VLSQLAQAVQRSVRFSLNGEQYIFSRTWFGFFHDLPEGMLFNLSQDPFTMHNTAEENPDTVGHAEKCYTQWLDKMGQSFPGENDPMQTVLEDAILNFSSNLDEYAERLGETGRESWAERITDLL
jgi:arylsulfatase A-like enzyme